MEIHCILGFIIWICLFYVIQGFIDEYKKQSELKKTRLESKRRAEIRDEMVARRSKQIEISEEYEKVLKIKVDNEKKDFFKKIEKFIGTNILVKKEGWKLERYKIISIYKKDMITNISWLFAIEVYIDLTLSFICCSDSDNSKIEIIKYNDILEFDELFDNKLREF